MTNQNFQSHKYIVYFTNRAYQNYLILIGCFKGVDCPSLRSSFYSPLANIIDKNLTI
jgi:hypothetical protein